MITAYEINKEILLQVAILEAEGFKPYIVEMPLEYGKILLQPILGDIKFKRSDKWNCMNMKIYFGGKGINVCGKAYKS